LFASLYSSSTSLFPFSCFFSLSSILLIPRFLFGSRGADSGDCSTPRHHF
jgi:hypothetical protein